MSERLNQVEKIIVICGPTGVGKTSFAIKMAQRFNGEIIGADSMQIYKYMDIGTAKPDAEERALIRHHLIDFLDPAEAYDAARFAQDADRVVQEIRGRGRVPIVAGGTGFYIKALLHGLFRSEPIDPETMEKLETELKQKGNMHLYARLEECDPQTASELHPNDTFRVIRALEFYMTNHRRISDFRKEHSFSRKRYDYLKFGLFMDREKLYERINRRVDIMLLSGLLKEVADLVEKGYSLDLKSMQSIGYKHLGMFINGETDWDETVRLLKRDTRRYAKRQFTWFRQDEEINWVRPDQVDDAVNLVKDFLK